MVVGIVGLHSSNRLLQTFLLGRFLGGVIILVIAAVAPASTTTATRGSNLCHRRRRPRRRRKSWEMTVDGASNDGGEGWSVGGGAA
jgi:hypothetical protein